MIRRTIVTLLSLLAVAGLPRAQAAPAHDTEPARPHILLLTVDTLRADRLSGHGYERRTSPNLDRLMASGVRFTGARTVEPLTAPALGSLLTSRYPHQHGATRNGLRMRSGQSSLPRALHADGYRTAAFVGNWTLKDKLSGLGEHFESYTEVLTHKRWFGLVRSEATAVDLNRRAIEWLERHARRRPGQPFMLWVHYTEPHAPYRTHDEYMEPLGLRWGHLTASDRYDTEVAFVDAAIGQLLGEAGRLFNLDDMVVVFAADHGESLGEHGYWGHGRHLYEQMLRIPMSITWPSRLEPHTFKQPALIIDLMPTLLALIGQPVPVGAQGFDWAAVLRGAEPPRDRVTRYEAHRGAVWFRHDSQIARRAGLLTVSLIRRDHKEILRIQNSRHRLYSLDTDPGELEDLTGPGEAPSEGLLSWMRVVQNGLTSSDYE